MSVPGAPVPSLEFLVEPSFLISRNADILHANAAGLRLLGADVVGQKLTSFIVSPHDVFDTYLRRCSGSTAPLVGAALIAATTGTTKYRLSCAALRVDGPARPLVLRCFASVDDQFSALSLRVLELNRKLHERARENALLQQALRQNETLLRELQHRVKNNIQMMSALIRMSMKGQSTAESADLVESASLRLQAMASTQDAIYRAKQIGTVAADTLLQELLTSTAQGFGVQDRLQLEVSPSEISSDVAHCLALIANELVTNAIKYGLNDPDGAVHVIFEAGEGRHALIVRDNGPGFAAEAVSRSSGLKLVRGLCRQIGATLDIANCNGTTCTVRFNAS